MSITKEDVKTGRLNDELGTQLESISAQIEANVEEGRNKIAEWKASAMQTKDQAVQSLQDLAQNKPWQLVASATAVGLLLGLLFAGRRN